MPRLSLSATAFPHCSSEESPLLSPLSPPPSPTTTLFSLSSPLSLPLGLAFSLFPLLPFLILFSFLFVLLSSPSHLYASSSLPLAQDNASSGEMLDLYKWTLGSIFAGITAIGGALVWITRYLLDKLFNEDLNSKGIPKGYIAGLHATGITKLENIEAALGHLSPDKTTGLVIRIEEKLVLLEKFDEAHAEDIRELRDLIQRLIEDLNEHRHETRSIST